MHVSPVSPLARLIQFMLLWKNLDFKKPENIYIKKPNRGGANSTLTRDMMTLICKSEITAKGFSYILTWGMKPRWVNW